MFPNLFSRKNKGYYVHAKDTLVCGEEIVPIIDGIPRFVDDKTYASPFGDQWKQYKVIQFDSFTKTTISHDRLERCLGPELNTTIAGKTVLEAGCGAGRFTEVLLKKGALLVSSDITTAVEVNKENFPVNDQHLVIQADINNMPFEKETFDIVVCLGVIQHTPDPETTIKNLYELVKKGGCLVIDHYTLTRSYLFRTASFYRWFLKKQPPSKTIPYTRKLVKRYLRLHRIFKRNKLLNVLLNRISPVVSYYRALPQLSEEHQEQWALLDTHDSLTDWYKHFRSKRSIIKTLKRLGGEKIWCEYGGNGVEARCRKPGATA